MAEKLVPALLQKLQSDDELGLVDAIDKLRSQGISHYVSLPQLIVCGDQSSGKSSVLDAISGIPFPTKDNLCTRFATEVILRRTATSGVSVAIVPSQDRPDHECKQLTQFQETLTGFDDIPTLVERAKDAMGLSTAANAFSNDVLRIEISGPERPHLTIVDLPGLIHSENKLQKAADVELVQQLVQAYMSNPRSIILAVVSAKNDYANQVVLKLAREVDPKGLRTLGVITKPDTLPAGSESETAFVALARNEDVYFRLGWHVLKNRDFESRDCTAESRDHAENVFFSSGVWSDLSPAILAVAALRQRLSRVLLNQIRNELPHLAAEIETNLAHCRTELNRLGHSRRNADEQRLYLLRISQSFQSVVKAAKDGSYGDSIFGDPRTADGYCMRLRAVIQNLNLDFTRTMRMAGHNRRIIEDDATTTHGPEERTITRTEYLKEIGELLRRNRGRELPGMFNPLIVSELFYEQSAPWNDLAQEHINLVWESCVAFLNLVVGELADNDTAQALRREVIRPAMDEILRHMNRKLEKILAPFRTCHPITYNHYFTETIQNVREKRLRSEVEKRLLNFFGVRKAVHLDELPMKKMKVSSLVGALTSRNEADMDRYACSEVLDCMEAYYKVAMKMFVDNIAVQCVENKLVSKLEDIFSPARIIQMGAHMVGRIAAESSESQAQRNRLSRKLAVLKAGAGVCNQFVGQSSTETLQHHQWPAEAATYFETEEDDSSPITESDEDEEPVQKSDPVDGVEKPSLQGETAGCLLDESLQNGIGIVSRGPFPPEANIPDAAVSASGGGKKKKNKNKKGQSKDQGRPS